MRDPVFLFPGQGSQYVGMGKQLWEKYPSVRQLFADASDLLAKDLRGLCFDGPEATLVQTQNVQPAITLVNLACLQALREEGVTPSAAAGHSLGEYAALCAAGVFSFAETMRLVHFRGLVMNEAASQSPGGMLAVFGLPFDTLVAICEEVADVGSVEVANYNSPRQLILTGEKDALLRAGELAKKKGAKLVVPLKVSGPWHSRFMAEASRRMREELDGYSMGDPSFPVISNVSAAPYPADPQSVREGLVAQMVRPVLWSDSMSRLLADGHRSYIEAGPGRVLTGLMRDIDREVKVVNVQDSDSLAKLLALQAESAYA